MLYCRNPNCETNQLTSKLWHNRTLLPIKCLTYPNKKQEPEKLIFYICSKCSYYDFENFGRPLTNVPLNLQTFLIPESKLTLFYEIIDSRGQQDCPFCELNELVDYDEKYIDKSKKTSKPVFKIKPSVYKLFIKGDSTKNESRRNYIGFLCLNCSAICYDPNFKKVKWSISEVRHINPLRTWNEVYKKKQEMNEEYLELLEVKTTPSNEIEKQKLKVWRKFKVNEPSKNQRIIDIVYLGPQHTGGVREPRSDRLTITLANLTIRQAKKAIKLFGTKRQKEQLK